MKYAASPSSVFLQNQNAGEGLGKSLPCTLRWRESSVGTCKASTGSRLERAVSLGVVVQQRPTTLKATTIVAPTAAVAGGASRSRCRLRASSAQTACC
jgi:hypothetical protein